MTTDLILGTAGHIDHGKTSLIRALTGTETDRLPEEKKRGITIELGFAELEVGRYRLGIVDVPGHERFVRNMLAGATGMDLAMLVVAADDSVKQQTIEHLEILRMLELRAGVIAITKCDLVEDDWIELVEEEVRDRVQGSFLDGAPIIRTSAGTGLGLDALREALRVAAEEVEAAHPSGPSPEVPFRLPIDRTFTMAGHGTVVTGSVASGVARVGDEVMLEPGGIPLRIRSLQNHDRQVEHVHRGQRAAINLVGVHHEQIRRGHEVAAPGHLRPSRLFSVSFSLLPTAPRPLKRRQRVRLHLGTAEFMAGVIFLDTDKLDPGSSCLAQLILSDEAVATWNQPFVARSESPVTTIGGGRVLDPVAPRLQRPTETEIRFLGQLMHEDPVERASAALFFTGTRPWSPQDLARTAGIRDSQTVTATLRERGDLIEIAVSPTRTLLVHQATMSRLGSRVERALERLHADHPLRTGFDESLLRHSLRWKEEKAVFQAVLEELRRQKRVRGGAAGIALVGHGPQLSANERKLLQRLIDEYREAGIQAPTVKDMQERTRKNQDSVSQLVQLAAADGELVEVGQDYYLHRQVDEALRAALRERLEDGEGLTVSQIREILQATRKYVVPYCEYLDRTGFTRRVGDVRVLAETS